MKLSHIITASAAIALLGGAALAQTQPADPAPAPTAAMPMPEPSASSGASGSTEVTTPLASSATIVGENASVTTTTVTNGPVADTPENRAKYGQPMSRAGKRTAAKGN